MRTFKVMVDGVEAGKIKNGSWEEFIVEPGNHVIQCHISWFSSPEFQFAVNRNEIVYLRCKGAARFYFPLTLLFVIGLMLSYFYSEEAVTRPAWLWWFKLATIAPYFLYALYYVTFGRKQYLKIEEDPDNVFAS